MSYNDDPVICAFKAECNRTISEVSEFLANGGAADHAAYKTMVGKIRGINIALELLDDVIQNYLHKEDFDEDDDEGTQY